MPCPYAATLKLGTTADFGEQQIETCIVHDLLSQIVCSRQMRSYEAEVPADSSTTRIPRPHSTCVGQACALFGESPQVHLRLGGPRIASVGCANRFINPNLWPIFAISCKR